jgi:hypothetical protein
MTICKKIASQCRQKSLLLFLGEDLGEVMRFLANYTETNKMKSCMEVNLATEWQIPDSSDIAELGKFINGDTCHRCGFTIIHRNGDIRNFFLRKNAQEEQVHLLKQAYELLQKQMGIVENCK